MIQTTDNRPQTADQEQKEPVNFAEIFGNQNPIEFEVGCGKGKFLIGLAELTPSRNFFGIDRAGKWMRRSMQRSEKKQIQNIRFLKAEAVAFLQRAPEESVAVFHMYFPDPWPKRRHHSRRTINAGFLTLLHSRLEDKGLVEIATDDADYYTQIRGAVDATAALWKQIRESRNERITNPELKTNYEIKFQAEGRTLYYLELKK